MRVFRRLFYALVPRWLSTGDGELVLASLGAVKDMALERMRSGMIQRFPSYAGPDALSLIGVERGIPRGRTEVQAHYVQRLKRWRWPRGHRTRGSAFALLEQVSEYFGGIPCATIDDAGNVHHRAADGTEMYYVTTWNWDGQGLAHGGSATSRFWLWLYTFPAVTKSWGTWDAGIPGAPTWDDAKAAGYTWDQQGVTTDDIKAIRDLFRRTRNGVVWKPAGTRAVYAITSTVSEADTPTIVPDGTWDTPAGRAGAPAVLRFWALT